MIQISTQTAKSIARRHFANIVAEAFAKARPDAELDRDALHATVEAHYEAGEEAGFTTEADLGLYCLACHFDPEAMDAERGRAVRDTRDSLNDRRFALKSDLDSAGHLPFGSHEAIPNETESP